MTLAMRRELKKLVTKNMADLRASKQNLEAIFNIVFRNRTAVMAEDNDGFRVHKYTYGEMADRIEKAACGLYSVLGDTHSWVGLEMENSVDWIAAFWGVLKSGNKPYLVNTRHPKAMTEGILKTLGITHVVSDKKGQLDTNYVVFSELPKGDTCPAEFENEIAIATSATSLKESVCIYEGKNIAAQIFNSESILKESRRMALHYKGSLKQLAFLPFYHIFGLFAVYFWFTFFNRTIVFLKDLAPDTILNTVRRHEVTHIFAVPLLWHTIEKKVLKTAKEQGKLQKLQKGIRLCTRLQNVFPFMGQKLAMKLTSDITDKVFGRSVRFLISGGSFIKPSTLELFNGIGYPLHNGYGMSEIGISSVELRKKPKHRNEGSIGRPFDSVECRISDEGIVEIKGTSLCSKKLTGGVEVPLGEWFSTDDIMEVDKNGYLFIKGRKSDLVIGDNGENINPDMLEPLFSHPDIINLSVLGLNTDGDEQLTLVAQVSPYLSAVRIRDLREAILAVNASLPSTQQMRKIYMTYDPIVSKTAIKVSRAYLKRAVENGSVELLEFEKAQPCTESQNNVDPKILNRVLELVAPILELKPEEIDPDAHLMLDLGATSLQYFSMLSVLAEEFGLSAEQGEKYTYTIREFCRYIERHI